MTSFGYDKRLSAGCIAASGTLASLIPPSIIMVIYAILTEQSVALLLMAGLVPGLLSAAADNKPGTNPAIKSNATDCSVKMA